MLIGGALVAHALFTGFPTKHDAVAWQPALTGPLLVGGTYISLSERPAGGARVFVDVTIGSQTWRGFEPERIDVGAAPADYDARHRGRFRVGTDRRSGAIVVHEIQSALSSVAAAAHRVWVVDADGHFTHRQIGAGEAAGDFAYVLPDAGYGDPALWPAASGLLLGGFLILAGALRTRPAGLVTLGFAALGLSIAIAAGWGVIVDSDSRRLLIAVLVGCAAALIAAYLVGSRVEPVLARRQIASAIAAGSSVACAVWLVAVLTGVGVASLPAPLPDAGGSRGPGDLVAEYLLRPVFWLVAFGIGPALGLGLIYGLTIRQAGAK